MSTTTIACGKIITGSGDAIENGTIAVDAGGRIESIARGGASAGKVLDWSAYTVMPGLVDVHDHLSIDMGDEEAQARESTVTHVLRSARNARTLLHAGITTLREVGARGHIDLEIRDAVARGEIEGPRLLVSGQFLTRTGGHGWFFTEEADGPDEVRKAVRKQAKARVDLIKFMATGGIGTPNSVPTAPGYTKAEVEAIVDEAHACGLKVAAHLYGGPAARWAIDAGLDSVEHGAFLDRADLEAMRDQGTYLVVTWGVIDKASRSEDVPDYFRTKAEQAMRSYKRVLEQAIELGVNIAVGGDTYHARTTDELVALLDAGMTPMQALQAATRNGADLCGVLDRTGTIETGKWADLIAVEGDPLVDIHALERVRGVMKEGRVVRSS